MIKPFEYRCRYCCRKFGEWKPPITNIGETYCSTECIEAHQADTVEQALLTDKREQRTLEQSIMAEIAKQVSKDIDGVIATQHGNTIKVQSVRPAEFIDIDFTSELDELDEKLKP